MADEVSGGMGVLLLLSSGFAQAEIQQDCHFNKSPISVKRSHKMRILAPSVLELRDK